MYIGHVLQNCGSQAKCQRTFKHLRKLLMGSHIGGSEYDKELDEQLVLNILLDI